MRMSPDQLPVRAYNKINSDYRAIGRPKMCWIDNIKDILNRYGLSAAEATHLALERKLKLPQPLRFTARVDNL